MVGVMQGQWIGQNIKTICLISYRSLQSLEEQHLAVQYNDTDVGQSCSASERTSKSTELLPTSITLVTLANIFMEITLLPLLQCFQQLSCQSWYFFYKLTNVVFFSPGVWKSQFHGLLPRRKQLIISLHYVESMFSHQNQHWIIFVLQHWRVGNTKQHMGAIITQRATVIYFSIRAFSKDNVKYCTFIVTCSKFCVVMLQWFRWFYQKERAAQTFDNITVIWYMIKEWVY